MKKRCRPGESVMPTDEELKLPRGYTKLDEHVIKPPDQQGINVAELLNDIKSLKEALENVKVEGHACITTRDVDTILTSIDLVGTIDVDSVERMGMTAEVLRSVVQHIRNLRSLKTKTPALERIDTEQKILNDFNRFNDTVRVVQCTVLDPMIKIGTIGMEKHESNSCGSHRNSRRVVSGS